jgi:DNA-binding NtrC family response regulator
MAEAGEGRVVLVLDDDPVVTTVAAELLAREGFGVLVANRPEDAFELLARQQVHVVMSDQCMPAMTGVEFLRTVRRLYPATHRMIFSAQGDFAAALDAINHGAVQKFLLKPLQPCAVLHALREAFAPRRRAGAGSVDREPALA